MPDLQLGKLRHRAKALVGLWETDVEIELGVQVTVKSHMRKNQEGSRTGQRESLGNCVD